MRRLCLHKTAEPMSASNADAKDKVAERRKRVPEGLYKTVEPMSASNADAKDKVAERRKRVVEGL